MFYDWYHYSYGDEIMDLFKELLPNLLEQKTPILQDEKDYNPFVVNKALTAWIDTILYANEMNQNFDLDRQLQYDYLFYSIRKQKRKFQPWLKQTSNTELEAIQEYFQCSTQKVKEAINILTKEQIKEIVDKVKSKEIKK